MALDSDERDRFRAGLHRLDEIARGRPSSDWPDLTRELYTEIDAIYLDLEEMAGIVDPAFEEALFSTPDVAAMLPRLHAFRATFEYIEEWDRATGFLNGRVPIGDIEDLIDRRIGHLGAELLMTLSRFERIVFVGSGPLPVTPIALGRYFGREIVCVDKDGDANALAGTVQEKLGHPTHCVFETTDILDYIGIVDYDAVLCAFLAGVGTEENSGSDRNRFASDVAAKMSPGSSLILRATRGLGKAIYPEVHCESVQGALGSMRPERPSDDVPYNRYHAELRVR